MKKIFAVIMALVMMLSASAFAAGMEIGLSSVTLVENNEIVMQIPDPGIRIAFAENAGDFGLRAALVADGQTALEAVITANDEILLARATGISDTYGVNIAQAMELLAPYMDQFTSMIPSDLQLTEADMEIVNKLTATAGAAVSAGMYTSDDGATMGVKIGAEDMRTLWNLVVDLAAGHPEMLDAAGMTAADLEEVRMPDYVNLEADASMSYTEAGISAGILFNVSEGTDVATVGLTVETDGASFVNIDAGLRQGDFIAMGAEIALSLAETDGAWLIPTGNITNAESIVNVLAMDEAQLNKLMGEAQGILSMFGLA